MKKKITSIALLICLLAILIVGVSVSLAYFTDKETKTNTFTMGKGVEITMDEHAEEIKDPETGEVTMKAGEANEVDDGNGGKTVTGYDYTIIPGSTYHKEPIITVDEGSTDCYLIGTVTLDKRYDLYMFYWNDEAVHQTWGLSLAGAGKLVSGGVADWTVVPEKSVYTDKQGETHNGTFLTGPKGEEAFIEYKEDVEGDKITYTFYFLDVLSEGDYRILFNALNIPTSVTSDDTWIAYMTMEVNAYAIQTEGFKDVFDAWNGYNAEA